MLLACLGDGRIAEDLGFGKALDESANWIVQVPPGHDYQQACRVAEASEEVVREPPPSLVTHCFVIRLGSALDWIVYNADVQPLAGDLALDGGVAKGAAMADLLQ